MQHLFVLNPLFWKYRGRLLAGILFVIAANWFRIRQPQLVRDAMDLVVAELKNPQGDSTKLIFHQPESRIQSEHPWPAPWISKETGNSAYYLTNVIQFLNEAGEWFLDRKANKIYYLPH